MNVHFHFRFHTIYLSWKDTVFSKYTDSQGLKFVERLLLYSVYKLERSIQPSLKRELTFSLWNQALTLLEAETMILYIDSTNIWIANEASKYVRKDV